MLMFADFLQSRNEVEKNLSQVNSINDIIAFLDTRRKTKNEDLEQKWITTWNDYLWRIKYSIDGIIIIKFYRFSLLIIKAKYKISCLYNRLLF
jgi:hypothetical protein